MRRNSRSSKHDQRARGDTAREEDAAVVVTSLRRLFKALHVYSKGVLRRNGLSGPQLWALAIMAKNPGLSLKELAARMFAHPSTVSGVVERLVRRGAVERAVDARDRRGVVLTLTVVGRRLVRRSPPPIQESLRRGILTLPPRRLRGLREALEHVAHATEADRVEAPFFELQ